ncbi:PrsW family intramembrane metalloprotease [Treponema medium]|uniref:PrsW family glutamic-type intramembrane protease n=1 Tax=Treponema medium TaxID=58231 RepID=UPI00197E41E6|nr:PrsW family glutamic-type intramembrane protease [Treponema medium]QSH91113.1 PrsW family intramembrane metalloprotease [Treponema medium]
MSIIGLLITAFLPASVAICITVKKYIPVYALAAVFFAAAASLLPVLALQHSVHTFLDADIAKQSEAVRLLFNSFITAALIEETVKAAAFGLTAAIVLKKRFGITQSMLLGVFFGFIFSGFENISYNLRYSNVQFLRLVTAALLHGTLGCFYASMISTETKRKAAFVFLAAVVLHGLYNFFISLGGGFILPAAAVLGIACLYAGRLVTPSRP